MHLFPDSRQEHIILVSPIQLNRVSKLKLLIICFPICLAVLFKEDQFTWTEI